MNEEVANILTKNLIPKDFEKNQFGEVFTPLYFIEQMLDELPASVWKDKTLKWFDPACGIGNFPIVVYYRLMHSLRNTIERDAARSKHIIEKMLFMNELNKYNVTNCKKIFAMIDVDASPNIINKDFLQLDGEDKYDIIIGNPPYNDAKPKDTSAQPLYSKFIMKAIDMTSSKLLFVVPSRWFSGGNGLDDFRKFMLSRKDIVSIHHIPNSRSIWPAIDVKGGVNYFYLNKSYKGLTEFVTGHSSRAIQLDKYDILVPDPRAYPLINKALKYPSVNTLYLSMWHFGMKTNFEHFKNKPSGNATVKCYVSAQKGGVKYVDPKYIKNPYNFWKVFTPNGSGRGGDGFGKFIIASNREVASQTYFGFRVGSLAEAKSLKSYLETDFANYMVSLRKIDQHISESTLKWVPLPPLDREWTDAKVAKYFGVAPNRTVRVRQTSAKTVKQR
jgi:site-specific DNA-methyltransferase (adenine-specific)